MKNNCEYNSNPEIKPKVSANCGKSKRSISCKKLTKWSSEENNHEEASPEPKVAAKFVTPKKWDCCKKLIKFVMIAGCIAM